MPHACITNVRVGGSVAGGAGDRGLGEVGGVSRATPQVRHTPKFPSFRALCPLGYHSTPEFPGDAVESFPSPPRSAAALGGGCGCGGVSIPEFPGDGTVEHFLSPSCSALLSPLLLL